MKLVSRRKYVPLYRGEKIFSRLRINNDKLSGWLIKLVKQTFYPVFVTGILMGIGCVTFGQAGSYSWNSLPKIEIPVFKKDTFNITQFGAVPDGIALNTSAINKAIEHCSRQGGGVVLVPPGVWLTGPLELKNNVNLHISRTGLLLFTTDKSRYKLVEGNFEGRKAIRNQSPISGRDLENIAITGDGIIDGNGDVWRPVKKEKLTEGEWQQLVASGGILSEDGKVWYPSEGYRLGERWKSEGASLSPADYESIKDFLRPNLVVLTNCSKVLLQGVNFQNSPAWGLHTIFCTNITFDGIRVRNRPSAQNGDGIDIESCSYVEVKNCTLDCGDDGICIKSGKDEEGRRVGKPSQYIIIRNNIVYRGHGGFVIGSEMSGGVHDVFVSDCMFIGTDVGLRFKTTRGRGGIVENIHIRNINMHNIVHDAIVFDMYYFTKAPDLVQTNGKVEIPPVDEGTPQFRKFYISNLVCESADRAMLIRGLPEMSIRDIHMDNVIIKANRGADVIEANNIHFKDVKFQCTLSKPLINLENSRNILFDRVVSLSAPEQFFSINGDRSQEIKVNHTDMSTAKEAVIFNFGAKETVFSTDGE